MATTVDEIILRLEAQGADDAARRVRGLKSEVEGLGSAGAKAGSGGVANMAVSVGSLAMAAQAAMGTIGVVAGMLATLSGIKTAAQFQDIALALETVTGSAEKAAKLMRELRKMGSETPFDTAELAQFASQLIAAGTASERVTGQLRTLADLAAYSRVPRAELPRFLGNLMQLRGQPTPQMEDLKEMVRLAPALGKIVAAGTGQSTAMTSIEAMKTLQTMTGQQAFDTILRGTEAIAKGAAKTSATLSIMNAFGNMIENLGMIMEPTGQVFIKVLGPVVALLSDVAQRLGALNAFTHGIAGLLTIAAIVAKSWTLVRNSMVAARVEINRLIASINTLAVSSGAAAAATTGQTAANVGSGAAGAAGAAAAAVGWSARLRSMLGTALRGAFRFLKSGLGAGLALEGLGFASSLLPGQIGKYLSSVLSGAGFGVALGSLGGPWGMLAGGIIGGIIGGIQQWMGDRADGGLAGDGAAAKLETTNQILKDIRGHMIGGGGRAQSALAAAEIEIAIARRFAMGYG